MYFVSDNTELYALRKRPRGLEAAGLQGCSSQLRGRGDESMTLIG